MKYIFFGLPTFISSRIINTFSHLGSSVASGASIIGVDRTDIQFVMSTKEGIKSSPHLAYYLPSYPPNALPMFAKLPPCDFEYSLIYLNYTIHDYILYKAIESIQNPNMNLQDINRFILSSDNHVKAWKSLYDRNNKTGAFDLSFVKVLNVEDYVKTQFNAISEISNANGLQIQQAMHANSPSSALYTNPYNIPEHFYNSTKDLMLGDNTLKHILEL